MITTFESNFREKISFYRHTEALTDEFETNKNHHNC